MTDQIVGRAELKLAEAVKVFGYDFRGKVVLDIGSSTGGFTEYALRKGAAKVIAVEKGTRQMKTPLRFDPKVELHEKTDIFDVVANLKKVRAATRDEDVGERVVLTERIDTILADVSFVSLTKVLAHAEKNLADARTDLLVMLKPQFEAYPDQLVRGVVKNEKMRREIMRNFERWLMRNGFVILKKCDNETVGKVGGNRERFYWLKPVKKT